MKLHHKVNKPIQLLAIIVAIEVILHGDINAAKLVILVVTIWIAPTLRIRKKRARKPRAPKTPKNGQP